MDARRTQAVEMAVETFDALVSERGDTGKIWASVLKEAIKLRKPDFSESYYGFRTFGNLLEEAQARGLLEFGRDEKSGAYVYRSSASPVGNTQSPPPAAQVRMEVPAERPPSRYFQQDTVAAVTEPGYEHADRRDRGRRGRRPDATPSEIAASSIGDETPDANDADDQHTAPETATAPDSETRANRDTRHDMDEQPPEGAWEAKPARSYFHQDVPATATTTDTEPAPEKSESRRRSRGGRKPVTTVAESAAEPMLQAVPELPQTPTPALQAVPEAAGSTPESTGKPAARPRRPRKAAPKPDQP
jgi:hypothetical protein